MLFGYSDSARNENEPLMFGFRNLLKTLWQNVYPLVKLNLVFLLFCIPVITVPAAVTALHGGCVDLIRGERVRTFRLFLKTERSLFFQSWAVLLILLVPCMISVMNAWFYFSRVSDYLWLLVPGLVMSAIAVVLLLMLPYALTMLARVDLSILKLIKNAFLLVFLNLPFTLCSSLLILLALVLTAIYWIYALPLTLTVTLSLCSFLGTYFSLYALQKFVLTQEL